MILVLEWEWDWDQDGFAEVFCCRPGTTLLCEPLNVIIGGVTHKARNLLHTSQPPNNSMLANAVIATVHWVLHCRSMDDRCPCLQVVKRLFIKFTTAYCCHALRSYSSFLYCLTKKTSSMSVTRSKCHNDLAAGVRVRLRSRWLCWSVLLHQRHLRLRDTDDVIRAIK